MEGTPYRLNERAVVFAIHLFNSDCDVVITPQNVFSVGTEPTTAPGSTSIYVRGEMTEASCALTNKATGENISFLRETIGIPERILE